MVGLNPILFRVPYRFFSAVNGFRDDNIPAVSNDNPIGQYRQTSHLFKMISERHGQVRRVSKGTGVVYAWVCVPIIVPLRNPYPWADPKGGGDIMPPSINLLRTVPSLRKNKILILFLSIFSRCVVCGLAIGKAWTWAFELSDLSFLSRPPTPFPFNVWYGWMPVQSVPYNPYYTVTVRSPS